MSQQPTTLWHRGLTFKLLQFLSDRHMVRMIMEMVVNRSFTLITGKSICSRLRTLKNGVPQGSVLAPLLFNIYISDLTNTVYRKYTYTDDLAIMHADGNCQAVEGVMTKDTETVNEYLQTWKLMLGTTKTVSALGSFPPQQQGRVRELKVTHNNKTLPFCSEPKYLGVTLDRSFTYRQHLKLFRKKLTSRVAYLMQLAGSGWGAGATKLLEATLAPVHQQQSTVLQSGAAVFTPVSLNLPSTTPCQLWLNAYVLHQQTTFLFSQSSNMLSFVAKEPHFP